MATQDDIEKHYDVGNDFYEMCLDEKYLGYTCGVWDKATTNEQSQKDKFERLCHYANVKEGSNVLDVGCGWGGVMKFVSEKYPTAHVHGLTLSTKQIDYIDSLKPVSYTHLDVYKRQISSSCQSATTQVTKYFGHSSIKKT